MLNQLDLVLHALADPTRRAIIERLALGQASISTLAEPLDMSLAAVVQHVHVLEHSGLVRTQKEGRVRTCRIEPGGLSPLEDWIRERRALWSRRFDRLEILLAEQGKPGRKRK